MKAMPENQLNPKVKNVWRINDALWIVVCFGILIGTEAVIRFAMEQERFTDGLAVMDILMTISAVLCVAMLVVWLVVLPPIRFVRWRYELSEDYLDIAKGIIWRKRYIIPFIRVQNTDTRQGPILRMFGLASVTVSTAAGNHEIPGLAFEEANRVRDKAAELARLAREDV